MGAARVGSAGAETRLAGRVATGLEVFGQSVSNIAPSASLAALPALIAVNAGSGVWVSVALATVLMLLVGTCLSVFARHISTSGSLYTYTARSLGSTAAFASGVCLVIGYAAIGMDCVLGSAIYFSSFLGQIGIDAGNTGGLIVLSALAAVLGSMLSFRGIRAATRIALVMEIVSVIGIATVFVVILGKHGAKVDASQFKFHTFGFNGIILGVVLGVDSFVGFESAASLGIEARDPHRAIPRAVFISLIIVGVFYIVSGYTEVLGFGGTAALIKSGAPISDLAARSGVGGIKFLLNIGIGVSFLACIVACTNSASRQLFTMGKERVLSGALAGTSARHHTPKFAICAVAPVIGFVPIVMLAVNIKPLDGLGYTATVGTFGFLVCYAFLGAGAPLYLRRQRALKPLLLGTGVLTVLGVVYIFYKSVYPVPSYPYNVLPYVFGGLLVTAMAWYGATLRHDPTRSARLGTYEGEREDGAEFHGSGRQTTRPPVSASEPEIRS